MPTGMAKITRMTIMATKTSWSFEFLFYKNPVEYNIEYADEFIGKFKVISSSVIQQ